MEPFLRDIFGAAFAILAIIGMIFFLRVLGEFIWERIEKYIRGSR